jgi:hypothetical protein
MRKSCENGQVFAKCHEISFRENVCENFRYTVSKAMDDLIVNNEV